MNIISYASPATTFLPDPASGKTLAVLAPHAGRNLMLETAARCSIRGPVHVLDGGNHFNAYLVARAVRRHTENMDDMLRRINLARAFTCYQMESLLAAAAALARQRAAPAPATLVLDLLATFYDENVQLAERQRLLRLCQRYFKVLSAYGSLLISLRPAQCDRPDQQLLLDDMLAFVDDVWQAEILSAPAIPRLF
jgi:hypothetical protein